MINKKHLKVLNDVKCYEAHNEFDVDCQKKKCKNWIPYENGNNCLNIAIKKHGQLTFQRIGDIFDLTRMRICQIEKRICDLINDSIEAEKISD